MLPILQGEYGLRFKLPFLSCATEQRYLRYLDDCIHLRRLITVRAKLEYCSAEHFYREIDS